MRNRSKSIAGYALVGNQADPFPRRLLDAIKHKLNPLSPGLRAARIIGSVLVTITNRLIPETILARLQTVAIAVLVALVLAALGAAYVGWLRMADQLGLLDPNGSIVG